MYLSVYECVPVPVPEFFTVFRLLARVTSGWEQPDINQTQFLWKSKHNRIPETPVPGDPPPSSGLLGNYMCMMHRHRQNTHTHKHTHKNE